ncbi:ParA family protein [Caldivirga sp. UBA161]|uniref:ParA family protein n=1 Tax=Caldivirga sp. UBA161 TaxID=1915569 RepID=UPI0025C1EEC6|nr:ParA family protein [Caldivirga sp. UBA161]
MTVIITVVSGSKGGTGKTTIAVNTATLAAYRLRGSSPYPVVLLDLGVDNGSASKVLLSSLTKVNYTLSDYLTGKINNPLYALYLKSWVINSEEMRLVFSVPGSIVEGLPLFKLRYIIRIITEYLKPIMLVVDTPSVGFTRQFLEPIVSESTHVIPVTTVDHSSIESLSSIVGFIKGIKSNVTILPPILNMFDYKYPVDPTTGKEWVNVVEEITGIKPYTVAYDKLLYVARQAMEVEVLKISPGESQAIRDIIKYFNEVIAPLTVKR